MVFTTIKVYMVCLLVTAVGTSVIMPSAFLEISIIGEDENLGDGPLGELILPGIPLKKDPIKKSTAKVEITTQTTTTEKVHTTPKPSPPKKKYLTGTVTTGDKHQTVKLTNNTQETKKHRGTKKPSRYCASCARFMRRYRMQCRRRFC